MAAVRRFNRAVAEASGTFGDGFLGRGRPYGARENRLPPAALVACVLTGHGLKDPESVLRTERRLEAVPATPEALEQAVDEFLAVRR